MAELTIKCDDPDSVKLLVETAVTRQLKQLNDSIQQTKERIENFEAKYQMSTEEFLRRWENDEIQHRIDMEFDEWIGESWMLKSLGEEVDALRGIEFAN